jgi:hypothetical protein
MNFETVLTSIVEAFDEKEIQFALIGGLAMALRADRVSFGDKLDELREAYDAFN